LQQIEAEKPAQEDAAKDEAGEHRVGFHGLHGRRVVEGWQGWEVGWEWWREWQR
jgi:hypothetical protein